MSQMGFWKENIIFVLELFSLFPKFHLYFTYQNIFDFLISNIAIGKENVVEYPSVFKSPFSSSAHQR
jgi:hypothetical protein